jgi:hypothetical protein
MNSTARVALSIQTLMCERSAGGYRRSASQHPSHVESQLLLLNGLAFIEESIHLRLAANQVACLHLLQ